MKILALDPATKCGWCLGDETGVIASGTWDFSIRRDESSGMRLLRLRAKLDEIFALYHPEVTVFEAARHAAPKMQGALVVQAELQGVIKCWAEAMLPKVEYRGYSPDEIKKRALGGGRGKKEQMVELACEKWPAIEIVDDNHADALWLFDLAASELIGATNV